MRAEGAPEGPILVLDSASPRVSVAVGLGGAVMAALDEPLERSSRRLLEMIDEVLRAAGLAVADLGGIAALRGPGSFTGLRVGLATALGLRQALGMPATALSTLEVLASLAPAGAGKAVGAVDALRGEWAVQVWPPGGPAAGGALSDLQIVPASRLIELAPCALVGFGVTALAASLDGPGLQAIEAGPLAPAALSLLALADRPAWNPDLLTSPIYGRPPAVTLPKPRSGRAQAKPPEAAEPASAVAEGAR